MFCLVTKLRMERLQVELDTMVSGNVYKVLNDSISIGKDGRWLGGSLYSPSILCDNVSVASKA